MSAVGRTAGALTSHNVHCPDLDRLLGIPSNTSGRNMLTGPGLKVGSRPLATSVFELESVQPQRIGHARRSCLGLTS
jgi:hypothetical protein